MNTEGIQRELANTPSGAHHLIVYPDLITLRQVYSAYINTALNSNNETVIVFPFYENADAVKRALRESEFNIDVTSHEKRHSLLVMDSLKGYFGSSERVLPIVKQELERAKTMGKNGVSALGDLGSFFYRHKDAELMDYELSLPSEFDSRLKAFCLYHKRDFDARLTNEQKQKLLEHHQKNIVITTLYQEKNKE